MLSDPEHVAFLAVIQRAPTSFCIFDDPGDPAASAAVGTSEAASGHSCLCLPTLLRAVALEGCRDGNGVLVEKITRLAKARMSKAVCLGSALLISVSHTLPICAPHLFTSLKAVSH